MESDIADRLRMQSIRIVRLSSVPGSFSFGVSEKAPVQKDLHRSREKNYLTAAKPFSKSAIISSICSVPMESRMVFGLIP